MCSLLKKFLLAASSQKRGEESCYWERSVGLIKQKIKEREFLRKNISLPPSSVYSVFISNVSTWTPSWSLWMGKHWQVSSTALLSHFFRAVPLFIPDWRCHIFISVHRFLLLSERYYCFLSVTPSVEKWSRRCCVTTTGIKCFCCESWPSSLLAVISLVNVSDDSELRFDGIL